MNTNETKIIKRLVTHLATKGFRLAAVADANEVGEATPLGKIGDGWDALIRKIDSIGDALLYFSDPSKPATAYARWVRLIVGNDIDIVSDHGVSVIQLSDWNMAMDGFDPEVAAIQPLPACLA